MSADLSCATSRTSPQHADVAWSRDGRVWGWVDVDGDTHVFDASGVRVATLDGEPDRTGMVLALSPDGRQVAVSDEPGRQFADDARRPDQERVARAGCADGAGIRRRCRVRAGRRADRDRRA